MPSAVENLGPWEKAFLGKKPLLATSVFWQCATGVFFAFLQIYVSAVQLRLHKPGLYSRWWLVFPVLVIAVLTLSWIFLARASRFRVLLLRNVGQSAYRDNLLSAQSLTVGFFRATMGLGLALIVGRRVLL